ncbi:MAG: cyclic nucleotide-binding domain-containing protein [Burkholderiales bacterium]|nr:cyclic nucleotide-binding domain-containing protein [Burkholderiales bacterium]
MEVRRSVLVDHCAEWMFDLIEAAEHYPAFVPGCSAAEILERTDSVVAARITMRLAGIAVTMQTRNPKQRPTWMLIEMQPGGNGLMRRFRGEWRLTPLNARACRIDFTLTYELDGAVARVAQAAFDRLADKLVDAFVQRADRVLGDTTSSLAPAAPAPAAPAPQSPAPTDATMTSSSANLADVLRSTKLASELSDAQVQTLAGVMELKDLKEGEVLVREGVADEHLYVIVSGVLGVVKNAGAAEQVTMNTLSAGDLAGELSWLDGAQRYASLVAMAPTRVIGLERAQLESLVDKDARLIYRVMRAIVRSVHQIQYRLSMQQSELANYIYKQHGKY